MKKIKQWVNGLSIKKKLIFYGYITISPVMILISLVLLFLNYNKVQEEWLENNSSHVKALAESIYVLQGEIKDFSTYICINNQIHELLTAEDPEEKNKNARLWEEEGPLQLLQDMLALKGYIRTFGIYPENGIRPYLRGMDGSVHISDISSIYQMDIYWETINSEKGFIWRSIPKGSGEVYETNREDKIVLCREMFDLAGKTPLGYIVIGISQEYFQNLMKSVVNEEKEGVLVLGVDGKELSRYGMVDEEVAAYLKSEAFLNQEHTNKTYCFHYNDYEIIGRQGDENACIVCKVMPAYGFWKQIKDISYMPCMLLISMLTGLLPLLLILSNLVTRPMRQVSEAIRKFSAGDFEQKVQVYTHDEVGEVADCFNHMVEDIKRLIDENYVITLREKESELALLQAQINPHFLYNTLDLLYWKAMEEENDDLAESILALSQLFRLVLSQGKKEIPVENEMELVSCYLQIQKMRFSKRLVYRVFVEKEVKKVKIPKLIVQPFVENAIVHGFEKANGVCEVMVRAERDGDFVRFEIKDTGVGMCQEQIDEIWKDEPTRYAKQRIGKYAIGNIQERLRLKYQENFCLDIQSAVGKGTRVVLRIPFQEE